VLPPINNSYEFLKASFTGTINFISQEIAIDILTKPVHRINTVGVDEGHKYN